MHALQVSDELWEAYDRSPQKMRDTLWQALVTREEEVSEEDVFVDLGTEITVQYSTRCAICKQRIEKGEQALIRSIELDGKKQIIHMRHAGSLARLGEEIEDDYRI